MFSERDPNPSRRSPSFVIGFATDPETLKAKNLTNLKQDMDNGTIQRFWLFSFCENKEQVCTLADMICQGTVDNYCVIDVKTQRVVMESVDGIKI